LKPPDPLIKKSGTEYMTVKIVKPGSDHLTCFDGKQKVSREVLLVVKPCPSDAGTEYRMYGSAENQFSLYEAPLLRPQSPSGDGAHWDATILMNWKLYDVSYR
jgi:hypothetical protein